MKLTLTRKTYTLNSTIGDLEVDGKFECHVLEDPVRPEKIKHKTAIPAGSYNVVINMSQKFGVMMPLLEDVPNYAGIRIHAGNTPEDTSGCLLPGESKGIDSIGGSRDAYNALYKKLERALSSGDKVAIRIIEGGVSPYMKDAAPSAVAAGVLYRVTGDPLMLRSTPSSTNQANILAELAYGSVVQTTGKAPSGNWLSVTTEGREGWVYRSYLEALGTSTPPTKGKRGPGARARGPAAAGEAAAPEAYRVVNTDSLNLRSQPGVLSPDTLLAALPRGHVVNKIANSPKVGWWEIETVVNGQPSRGFVHAGFLAPASTVPAGGDTDLQINDKALELILSFEGMDQPSKWPGEQSGISLGHGYDLGYHTRDEFETDWGPHLSASQIQRLARAIGKKGPSARDMAPDFADIRVTKEQAGEVFRRSTIPKIKRMTTTAFPGVLRLPPDAQGALASLVYNRGGSTTGERRREMATIRDLCADAAMPVPEKVSQIADAILSMKRLWPDTPGLRRRRDAEAKMVRESA